MNFNEVFRLDTETGRLFWEKPPKNHAEKLGREAGAVAPGNGRTKPYWQVRAFNKTFKRSRVIFYMIHGRWPEPAVDHANGNSLDDRPVNLRECTYAENAVNSSPHSRMHELPRGVYLTKQGRFMARITRDGVTSSLGVYDAPETAQRIYEDARREAFGDFA